MDTSNPVYIALAVSALINVVGSLAPKLFKGKVAPKLLELSQTGGPNVVALMRAAAEILGMLVTALKAATGASPSASPSASASTEEKKDA